MNIPFFPDQHGTVNTAVSSSSSAPISIYNGKGPKVFYILNTGTATTWFAVGDSTIVASASNDIPIPPNVPVAMTLFNPGNGPMYAAAIAGASNGNLYFTPGQMG